MRQCWFCHNGNRYDVPAPRSAGLCDNCRAKLAHFRARMHRNDRGGGERHAV